jgi:hypothetical protein
VTLWQAYLLVGFGYFLSRVPPSIAAFRAKRRLGELSAVAYPGLVAGLVAAVVLWPVGLFSQLLGALGEVRLIVRVPPAAHLIEELGEQHVSVYRHERGAFEAHQDPDAEEIADEASGERPKEPPP